MSVKLVIKKSIADTRKPELRSEIFKTESVSLMLSLNY
jgi:hypothetical protein